MLPSASHRIRSQPTRSAPLRQRDAPRAGPEQQLPPDRPVEPREQRQRARIGRQRARPTRDIACRGRFRALQSSTFTSANGNCRTSATLCLTVVICPAAGTQVAACVVECVMRADRVPIAGLRRADAGAGRARRSPRPIPTRARDRARPGPACGATPTIRCTSRPRRAATNMCGNRRLGRRQDQGGGRRARPQHHRHAIVARFPPDRRRSSGRARSMCPTAT